MRGDTYQHRTVQINRRAFLFTASAALLLQAARGIAPPSLPVTPLRADPFLLGVASGDPEPDGFVRWPRLSTDTRRGDGALPATDIPVRWEVAKDFGFRRIIQKGTTAAMSKMGHAVHVEVILTTMKLKTTDPPAAFLKRRAAAFKAYYENMPGEIVWPGSRNRDAEAIAAV